MFYKLILITTIEGVDDEASAIKAFVKSAEYNPEHEYVCVWDDEGKHIYQIGKQLSKWP